MSARDRLLLGAGVVLGVVGLAVAFAPSLAPDVQVVSAVVAAIGLLALAAAVLAGVARYREDARSLALPTPEGRATAIPGGDIDQQISGLSTPDPRAEEPSERHAALRDRLEATARAVLVRDGIAPERAREQVDTGAWTDDPRAAAFLLEYTPRPSLRERLGALWSGEPIVARRARHAIAAIARRHRRSSPIDAVDRGHDRGGDDASIPVASLPSESSGAGLADTADGDIEFPRPGESIERRTGRWRGASAVALAVGATGIVLRRPALLLASAVGVGLAASARIATPPEIALDVEREVSDPEPAVGDRVEVVVTVRNVGDAACPDCTVIDGVPPGLIVVDGSPRHGVALRPGKTTRFSYTVRAARGEHAFDPASVVARDFTGSAERLARVEASGATAIRCVPRLKPIEDVPLRERAWRFGGRTPTDATGGGVEFHATREYRPGDPRARIDWNRLAKTGDLSVLEFRAERVPTVVVVIDARPAAWLAPAPDDRSAVDRSVEAAGRLVATLLDGVARVGVGALSTHAKEPWLAPDTGSTHRERVRRLLGTHPALTGTSNDAASDASPTARSPETGTDEHDPFGRLDRRLPSDAQVLVVTPVCDDPVVDWITRRNAAGHPTSVVSPDPTVSPDSTTGTSQNDSATPTDSGAPIDANASTDAGSPSPASTPGRQLARVERALRVSHLRAAGIPVLDWARADASLAVAIERVATRARTGAPDRGANAGWASR